MKAMQRLAIALITVFVAFLAGWNVSSSTGVEPGFFEAPGAAGYGAGTEAAAPEGISQELQQYYEDLSE